VQGSAASIPVVVKAAFTKGRSKGIYDSCVVRNANELEGESETSLPHTASRLSWRSFLPGREFTVAMIGNGEGPPSLPPVR